jgi:hypothetical protein
MYNLVIRIKRKNIFINFLKKRKTIKIFSLNSLFKLEKKYKSKFIFKKFLQDIINLLFLRKIKRINVKLKGNLFYYRPLLSFLNKKKIKLNSLFYTPLKAHNGCKKKKQRRKKIPKKIKFKKMYRSFNYLQYKNVT